MGAVATNRWVLIHVKDKMKDTVEGLVYQTHKENRILSKIESQLGSHMGAIKETTQQIVDCLENKDKNERRLRKKN